MSLLATSLGVVIDEAKQEMVEEVLNPLDMEMDDEDLLVSCLLKYEADS